MNKSIEDRLRLLEDKVDYLVESLNFLSSKCVVPLNNKTRFSIGDYVYKTEHWPYYEKGRVLQCKNESLLERGWSYYIEWFYNSRWDNTNLINKKHESWYNENALFATKNEMKSFLIERLHILMRDKL